MRDFRRTACQALASLVLGLVAATVWTANAAETRIDALPQFDAAFVGRTRTGALVSELPEFSLPLTNAAQEQSAWAVTQRGLADALASADAPAAIDYLAGYFRVRAAAEKLARSSGVDLPARDRFRTELLERAESYWREQRHGTALLAWILSDRVFRLPGEPGSEGIETRPDDNGGWTLWRNRVLRELSTIMPPTGIGFNNQGWALPPWSPVQEHPLVVLDRKPRPSKEGNAITLPLGPGRSDLTVADEGRKLHIQAGTPLSIELPAQFTTLEKWIERRANTEIDRQLAERAARLEAFDRRIAELEARVQREVPKISKTSTRQELTGYETVPTYTKAAPFHGYGPAVQQGDMVMTGSVQVAVYSITTHTIEIPDPNHPVSNLLRAAQQERQDYALQSIPSQSTNSLAYLDSWVDQWTGRAVIPLEIRQGTVTQRVNLRVPFTYGVMRPQNAAGVDALTADLRWRERVNEPSAAGAAEVHRAAAAWVFYRQLAARHGEELAARETALLGELLFAFDPDGGPLLQALRERFLVPDPTAVPSPYAPGWRGASLTSAKPEPGAPAAVWRWPVPMDPNASVPVPSGSFRLVHDPAVERQARELETRLHAAGLAVERTPRSLPRTAPLLPVLAFSRERTNDLGAFLWHRLPEQIPALHEDPAGTREVRLHAPVPRENFAGGQAWILAHPARFAEARALALKLYALGGPETLIEVTVSWRGLTDSNRSGESVFSADPHSANLQAVLARAGVTELGPIAPVAHSLRPSPPADLIFVLRGSSEAAPRGLSPEERRLLGTSNDTMLLFVNGARKVIKASDTAETSLSLW